MGSNPSSPIVLDVATLQALHRGGALEALTVVITREVADVTRDALAKLGPALVPDVDALAIRIEDDADVVALAKRLGARLVAEKRDTRRDARAAGVEVIGVARLLLEMKLDDAPERARRILATGWWSKELDWLSRGALT